MHLHIIIYMIGYNCLIYYRVIVSAVFRVLVAARAMRSRQRAAGNFSFSQAVVAWRSAAHSSAAPRAWFGRS